MPHSLGASLTHSPNRPRSEGRDASGHLAGVQELGDGLDDELRLVDLLDVRGARYDHERPCGRDRVDDLSSKEIQLVGKYVDDLRVNISRLFRKGLRPSEVSSVV